MTYRHCILCEGQGYYLDNFMRKKECKRCQSSSLAEREAKVRNDALREAVAAIKSNIGDYSFDPYDDEYNRGMEAGMDESLNLVQTLITTEEKNDG